MKLCIHCQSFNEPDAACADKRNETIDYVAGGTRRIEMYAQVVRMRADMCGADGAWFKAKVATEAAA
jgi:hypothetical protein